MKADLDKIKRLIKDSGMTQGAFADKCNITRSYFTQCLNGHKEVSQRTLKQIANEFNIDIYDLYMSSVPLPDVPEGETYIQCPCCKEMIAISLSCAKIKKPDDPFESQSCKK